jgi:TolB-like protein
MNKKTREKTLFPALFFAIFFAAGTGVAFILGACAGIPVDNDMGPTNTASTTTATQVYWTGNGAADISLAVLVPEGQGLADNEAYLPTMVQGVLVGDFTKFSAMKVLDRQNLEKVIAEGESGYYADESNFVQLGTVANVGYILNGMLQKTGLGFSLQLKVTDAASGVSKAVYTGSVPAVELEDLRGIKKASAELLAQLGVNLNDAGKANLLGMASSSTVQAETALARGIFAQRSGTIVEALSYYYEAAKFDSGLAEAASRGSVLSADLLSGNIGQNVRNDIQLRAAWVKVLDEAATFFSDHSPFELLYDPSLTTESIDYAMETAEISFEAKLIGGAGFRVIYDLDQGLKNTGRNEEWGIGVDSIYEVISKDFNFNAVLINEDGETIGRATEGVIPKITYYFRHENLTLRFSGVDANKITDKLTVSIVSINGMDAKTAGERGYMNISVENFAMMEIRAGPFRIDWLMGGVEITGIDYFRRVGDVVIPSKIGSWPVVSIGNNAFGGSDGIINRIASVTIPDSVVVIGERAFNNNQITSVTIGNSVTFIGRQAFHGNWISSVTIPANVLVDYDAFSGRFYDAYEFRDKKAGTYVAEGNGWWRMK